MKQCAVSGCTNPVRAWGWCKKHYQRWKTTGDPEGITERHQDYTRKPEAERFWQKVNVGEAKDCWEWQGAKLPKGYGQFGSYVNNKMQKRYAHRWSYEHHHGCSLQPEQAVHHTCNNPPCVNPAHLAAMPIVDHALIGSSPPATNRRKTHCVNGHEFNAENTYVWSDGSRSCRACDRERKQAGVQQ